MLLNIYTRMKKLPIQWTWREIHDEHEKEMCVQRFYIYLYFFFIYILFSLFLPTSSWWWYNFEAIAGKFTKAIRQSLCQYLCQSSIVWKIFDPSCYFGKALIQNIIDVRQHWWYFSQTGRFNLWCTRNRSRSHAPFQQLFLIMTMVML